MTPPSNVVILLLVGIVIPVQTQELHYWGEELKPVFGVLQDAHLSGSIGLAGRCDRQSPGLPQFSNPAGKASSPLSALRQIAASDPGMRVKQDADGTIRMTEKGVPNDILNVRISHIVFEDYAHHDIYSANFAVRVILSAPEVRSFMESHDIVPPQLYGGIGGIGGPGDRWPPDAPHISGSLDNVTVSEAISRVLAAFPGEVAVYWNCPAAHDTNRGTATGPSQGQQRSNSSPDCSSSVGENQFPIAFPARLPNPFCMPRSALPSLPSVLSITEFEEPSRHRRVFFYFFAMTKGFGGKMLIVGG